MIALAGSVLVASLLGSLHCAGMCGGFVCFVTGQAMGRRLAPIAYHAGRLVSYTFLGATAGALGAGIDRAAGAAGIPATAATLAGVLMVVWGGAAIARALGVRVPLGAPAPGMHRGIAAALRRLASLPPEARAFAVGLLTTLLPCGWLYAYVAVAAGTGSPRAGALVMAVFWAGTVPILAGLGFAARGALGPLARRLPLATAALLMLLGVLTLTGKLVMAPTANAAPRTGAVPAPGSHDCH